MISIEHQDLKTSGVPVEVRGLSKVFGETSAVDNISLTIEAGSCFTLLGPSGSGKTTVLRMIAGFERPSAGAIIVGGENITYKPAHKRNIGVVFQQFALFPHMTVAQNISYPLETRGLDRKRRAHLIEKSLDLVQLTGLASRFPSQISGGQQQRVALARALVFEPRLLLMDEPMSALDKRLRETMQIEIRNLQKRLGITTITVTHDQTEAMVMSDVIALLENGRLRQLGPPLEVYRKPASRYVANFIGESNLIQGSVKSANDDILQFVSSSGLQVLLRASVTCIQSGDCLLVLRPEYVTLDVVPSDTANSYRGEILEAVYLGDIVKYRVGLETGDQIFAKAMANGKLGVLAERSSVTVTWRPEDCLLLPK